MIDTPEVKTTLLVAFVIILNCLAHESLCQLAFEVFWRRPLKIVWYDILRYFVESNVCKFSFMALYECF